MVIRNKYMDFRLIGDTGKTQTYSIESISGGQQLGLVKWYGAWRQYTFYPEPDTIWNRGCLIDICGFLDELMEERREKASA